MSSELAASQSNQGSVINGRYRVFQDIGSSDLFRLTYKPVTQDAFGREYRVSWDKPQTECVIAAHLAAYLRSRAIPMAFRHLDDEDGEASLLVEKCEMLPLEFLAMRRADAFLHQVNPHILKGKRLGKPIVFSYIRRNAFEELAKVLKGRGILIMHNHRVYIYDEIDYYPQAEPLFNFSRKEADLCIAGFAHYEEAVDLALIIQAHLQLAASYLRAEIHNVQLEFGLSGESGKKRDRKLVLAQPVDNTSWSIEVETKNGAEPIDERGCWLKKKKPNLQDVFLAYKRAEILSRDIVSKFS